MIGFGDHLAFLGGDALGPMGFSLEGESPQAVFAYADRRCRIEAEPDARALLVRASSLRALDLHAAAHDDLLEAFRRDSDDPVVCLAVLRSDLGDALRQRAARLLVGNGRASDAYVDAALAYLASFDTGPVVKADRVGGLVKGWIGWTAATAPELEARGEEEARTVPLAEPASHVYPGFPGRVATFSFAWDPRQPVELRATQPGQETAVARLYAVEPPVWPGRDGVEPDGGPALLNVVVPLYRDAEATKACLEALALQDCVTPLRFFLIDDCSPEPDVSALAQRFCRLHPATLIVNRVNHGFAGSVNRAIAETEEGDVLLLNADVTLPPGALDRMVRAAYGDERIGTLMPLSNDSELTSFPIPFAPNPLPSPDLAIKIDDAASRANADGVVDLVNTIGYCVYVKRRCLRATGLLSQSYGQGYYEDVDLALTARQKGFRNVAATGIYVAHGSGRSFRERKRPLLSHNLPILCDRFPAFRAENVAFIGGDGLRTARGAIEAHLPPTSGTHLLVGAAAAPGSPLDVRAARIAQEGGFVLMVSWRQAGASTLIDIRAPAGFGPRSLRFTLEAADLDRLSGYVLALTLVQIELCDLHTIPSPLYRLLLRTSAPILFFIASLEDAMLVDSGAPQTGQERLTSRDITVDFLGFDRDADLFSYRIPQFLMRSAPTAGASKFVTADAMAEAVCADLQHRHRAAAETRAQPPFRLPARWDAKRVVAVLAPSASPAVDGLLLRLARTLRPRVDTRLVVLGRCLDDRALMAIGNVHVTGAAPPDDYPLLIEAYAADALFLPYRTSLFGVLDTLSARSPLPRAYFDWSAGLMPYGPEDFVLDCRLGEDVVCSLFARWCAAIGSEPEDSL